MELNRIESLLDAYFEGQTSLEEEAVLMDYFQNQQVAQHLLQYKPIFIGLAAARKERSQRPLILPEQSSNKSSSFWRYGVASAIVVALAVGGFYYTQPQMTQEEKEALAAFEDSKEALMLLSRKLNEGATQLAYVAEFGNTTARVFKEEE